MKTIPLWQEVSRETVFQKFGRKVDKVTYRMPDGSESDFYIRNEKVTAAIVALTKNNEVILAKQYRPGPNKILSELPGGFIDEGEHIEQGMQRELLEETGYEGKVEFVGSCYESAYSMNARNCFVATNCIKVAEPKLEEHEYIKVILLPLAEFRALLKNGQLTDVQLGYMGLDHLKLL